MYVFLSRALLAVFGLIFGSFFSLSLTAIDAFPSKKAEAFAMSVKLPFLGMTTSLFYLFFYWGESAGSAKKESLSAIP